MVRWNAGTEHVKTQRNGGDGTEGRGAELCKSGAQALLHTGT
jgi:hypothetical protein